MPNRPSQIALLARLERWRRIERHQALRTLAEAQAERGRLESLARRSAALAQDYAGRQDAPLGADLKALFAAQSHLGNLARTARELGRQADDAAERASGHLGRAERRLEQVRARRQTAQAQHLQQEQQADAMQAFDLARRLQRPSQRPSQPTERGRLMPSQGSKT